MVHPPLLFLSLINTISTILLILLTFPIMLAIRYLQLWNPLHQCQSGQPHRWVQRCPLQEVPGRDRLSRGGCCRWGGAPKHHSMTFDPEASFTSTRMAKHALNCRRQGLMETPTGQTKPSWNQNMNLPSHLLQAANKLIFYNCSLLH